MNTSLRWLMVCVVTVSSVVGLAAWTHVQEKTNGPADAAHPAGGTGGAGGLDTDAMMKIWEQMNAPGKNHEALARFVGTWKADCTFWIMPDAEPLTGTGTLTSEAIYDGRFVRSAFEGTGLDQDKPLLGTSILGYNTITKKFETFWIDSSTTGMMLATGDASADGKAMTFTHTFDDPLTGGKATAKYTYAWNGDDSFTFTMYRIVGEKEVKEGQIVYTRKK